MSLSNAGDYRSVRKRGASLLRQYPNSAILLNLVGVAEMNLEDLDSARVTLERALKLAPNVPIVQSNLGIVFLRSGNVEQGINSLRKALTLNPRIANAHSELGNTLIESEERELGLKHLQAAVMLEPNSSSAHYNLGSGFSKCGKYHEAIKLFTRALDLDPENTSALLAKGVAYHAIREIESAIEHYQAVLNIDSDLSDCHFNLGEAYTLKRDYPRAVRSYDCAVKLDAHETEASAGKYCALANMALWDEASELLTELSQKGDHANAIPLLMWHRKIDDAAWQLERASHYAEAVSELELGYSIAPLDKPISMCDARTSSPIRIGYISTNFREHPVMDLTTGLFREHDRSRFEVHAIGYGSPMGGVARSIFEESGAHVHDLGRVPDESFVEQVRSLDLDIAVDMTGYTSDTRTRLFAHGLAPLQVNYLAYPGTLGSEAFDYIVGDETVIPESLAAHYVEKMLWLPDSFMPCDNQREIADEVKPRSAYGLPDEGFVFCSFNNPVKISPREFDIWMRLLGAVEGSCLWLTGKNEWVPVNLRKQAEKRGIDPSRLVFTERVPMAEHLGRHCHADLFLDTFNYNAHTTANEALWAGLPLVTKVGQQFAARVAASLLQAVGLPELITDSEEAYEQLALALAQDPDRLSQLRAKLRSNRDQTALFDTKAYVRNFEAGLAEAHRRRLAGEAVSNIRVSDL